jgi:hypothetical protein
MRFGEIASRAENGRKIEGIGGQVKESGEKYHVLAEHDVLCGRSVGRIGGHGTTNVIVGTEFFVESLYKKQTKDQTYSGHRIRLIKSMAYTHNGFTLSEQSYKGTAAVFTTSSPRPAGLTMHTWKDLVVCLLELVASTKRKSAAIALINKMLRSIFVTVGDKGSCQGIVEGKRGE